MSCYLSDEMLLKKINAAYATDCPTMEDALRYVLEKVGNNMSKAARSLGVSRETLSHRAHKFGLRRDFRKKRISGAGNSLPRIDVTFDVEAYKAALKNDPQQSVCKFCSNKDGNKHTQTCINECPYRELYAIAQIKVDAPAHLGVGSFAKQKVIIPKR